MACCTFAISSTSPHSCARGGWAGFQKFSEEVMPRMCVADSTAKTMHRAAVSMHMTYDFCLEHWLRRPKQSHKSQRPVQEEVFQSSRWH